MGRFELKNVRDCEDGFTHAELVVNDAKPVFVAVYGTLMAGEHNAHWAGNAKRTTVTIKGDLFDTGWGFPAFVPEKEVSDTSDNLVRAELIETDDAGLAHMDVLEGYPRLYRRERICVHTGYGEAMAWVYVINNMPADARKIACGDWREYRKSKNAIRQELMRGVIINKETN